MQQQAPAGIAAPEGKFARVPTVGDGVSIQTSSIKGAGNGLYADRKFAKNELITEYDGDHIDRAAAEALREKGLHTHVRALQMGFAYIDGHKRPANGIGGGSFANDIRQSALTNAVYCTRFDARLGRDRVFLKALRAIDAGEEVFVSYGKVYWQTFGSPKRPAAPSGAGCDNQQQPDPRARRRLLPSAVGSSSSSSSGSQQDGSGSGEDNGSSRSADTAGPLVEVSSSGGLLPQQDGGSQDVAESPAWDQPARGTCGSGAAPAAGCARQVQAPRRTSRRTRAGAACASLPAAVAGTRAEQARADAALSADVAAKRPAASKGRGSSSSAAPGSLAAAVQQHAQRTEQAQDVRARRQAQATKAGAAAAGAPRPMATVTAHAGNGSAGAACPASGHAKALLAASSDTTSLDTAAASKSHLSGRIGGSVEPATPVSQRRAPAGVAASASKSGGVGSIGRRLDAAHLTATPSSARQRWVS